MRERHVTHEPVTAERVLTQRFRAVDILERNHHVLGLKLRAERADGAETHDCAGAVFFEGEDIRAVIDFGWKHLVMLAVARDKQEFFAVDADFFKSAGSLTERSFAREFLDGFGKLVEFFKARAANYRPHMSSGLVRRLRREPMR